MTVTQVLDAFRLCCQLNNRCGDDEAKEDEAFGGVAVMAGEVEG